MTRRPPKYLDPPTWVRISMIMLGTGVFAVALLVGGLSMLAASGPSDVARCGGEVMVAGDYCVQVPEGMAEPGPGMVASGDSYGDVLAEARDGDESGQGMARMLLFLAGALVLGGLVASGRVAWKRRRAARRPVTTVWPSPVWYPGWTPDRQ